MSTIEDTLINNAKLFIALVSNETIEEKTTNIIKFLNEGANVNESFANYFNNTPLHIAVKKEDLVLVELLLEKGADATLENNEGKNSLDLARELKTETSQKIIGMIEGYDKKLLEENENINIARDVSVGESDVTHKLSLYQKRTGTSGIKGELYETKLLSLILIRILLNRRIDHFYLGTSVQGIGALDDICLRYRENNKESVVFLQAKHIIKGKVMIKDLWAPAGNYSLSKYFNSYLNIRQNFESTNKDCLFQGRYEDTKCHFVIYTTAEDELTGKKTLNHQQVDKTIKDIINTGESHDIFQYEYNEEDIKLLAKIIMLDRMKHIGKKLYQFTQGNKYKNMLCDKHISGYHVVLAGKVIAISETIVGDARTGSFREEFLSSNNEMLIVLKEAFFKEAVLKTKINEENLMKLVEMTLLEPSPDNISRLLQTVPISYDLKNNKLDILLKKIQDLFSPSLYETNISHTTYNEAFQIAVKEKLSSINFKLPLTFGNIDLKVNGLDAENTLNNIALKIEKLISQFGDLFIINSEDKIDPSLIGNLLVYDEDNSVFKFNVFAKSLAPNAKKILNKLKTKIKDLNTYRFKFNTDNLPKITFDADELDNCLVKDFLNNLWFYTRQAKEHEIERYAKYNLAEYYNFIKHNLNYSFSQVQSDAVFLKIHDEVQKWWLLETTQTHYLTKNIQIFNTILNYLTTSTISSILNTIYLNEIQKPGIDFTEQAIECLDLDTSPGLTVVETRNKTLTAIKLHQYFRNTNLTFIDLNYTSRLSLQDNIILLKELEKNDKQTVIIIYEQISNEVVNLNDFLNLSFARKIVLVINGKHLDKIMNKVHIKEYVKVRDDRNNLRDLTLTSQAKVLKKKLIFQGMEVTIETLIDTDSKHLITADILNAINNNKIIEIGKILSSSNYEQTKDFYVQRCLYRSKTLKTSDEIMLSESSSSEDEFCLSLQVQKESIKIKTLIDIKNTVLLMAAPGMGKSTLLTHLSIETKKTKPQIWIERVNLLDHSSHFNKWQEKKLKIDIFEALRFLCKTVIDKNLSAHNEKCNSKRINFDIEVTNGILSAKYSDELDYLSIFELEIFIDCYNKGNTILIFDGFDEICPHYKNNVLDLLKCLAVKTFPKSVDTSQGNSEAKQQMWITSRPYNDIKKFLENEFGIAYSLKPFTDVEQNFYVEKYLRINLNLKDLNYQQFQNIDSLFEYMKPFSDLHKDPNEIVLIKSTSAPLHSLYCTAIAYFQSEISNTPISVDKIMFKQKWNSNIRWMKASELLACWNHISEEAMNLARTPLHMHIAVSYFETRIKSTVNINSPHQWDLDTNTFAFYENFLETKLKKIRFEEKNHMDLQNPDLMITYERERVEFITKHKQLAFYSIFKDKAIKILGSREIDAIQQTIRRIENGEEKTGLIEYVVKGVPKFVHLTFAEYLTVEYVTDLLQTASYEQQIKAWEFIVYVILPMCSTGILEIFDRKLNCDPKLMDVISSINLKDFIFDRLLSQFPSVLNIRDDSDQFVKMRASISAVQYVYSTLDIAVFYGMKNFAITLLTNVTEKVTVNNVDKFIDFIKKQYFFKLSVKYGYNKILEAVLDCVRRVDNEKLHELLSKTCRHGLKLPAFDSSNKEIIDYLKVNFTMGTTLRGRWGWTKPRKQAVKFSFASKFGAFGLISKRSKPST